MNGENNAFRVDPFLYVQNKIINIMNMSPSNAGSLGPSGFTSAMRFVFTTTGPEVDDMERKAAVRDVLTRQNQKAKGKFDLEKDSKGTFKFTVVSAKAGAIHTGFGSEDPLRGYWIPYRGIHEQGHGIQNVPYVDIPAALPPHQFVFTGSMNGCSLVVTRNVAGGFRVYHDSAHEPATFNGQNVVLRLDYAYAYFQSPYVYGEGNPPVTTTGWVPTSFNFLYFDATAARWNLVSQPQLVQNVNGDPTNQRFVLNPCIKPFRVQFH